MKQKKPRPATALELTTENGLNQAELKAALAIATACPAVVKAIDEYQKAEGEYQSRFWSLADELRKPQVLKGPAGDMPAQRLNEREVALLLTNAGEIKQRVTEWKRIVQLDDATYGAIRKLGLSKIKALGVARGSLMIEDGEDGPKLVEPAKPQSVTTNPDPKFHKLPKDFAVKLHNLLVEHVEVKAWVDDVPYELEGTTADGREYLLRLFVEKSPVKK